MALRASPPARQVGAGGRILGKYSYEQSSSCLSLRPQLGAFLITLAALHGLPGLAGPLRADHAARPVILRLLRVQRARGVAPSLVTLRDRRGVPRARTRRFPPDPHCPLHQPHRALRDAVQFHAGRRAARPAARGAAVRRLGHPYDCVPHRALTLIAAGLAANVVPHGRVSAATTSSRRPLGTPSTSGTLISWKQP